MKEILFISEWINPFEPTFGGAQRSNLMLQACAQVGHVDFVIFEDGVKSNMKDVDVIYSKNITERTSVSRAKKWGQLLTPWNPYALFPINRYKERIIDEILSKKQYDYIVVRYIPEAMSFGLMKYADRLIIDVDDNPKDTFRNKAKQISSLPNKIYHYIATWLVPITVRAISNRIHATFFPNPSQIAGKHGYFLPNVAFQEPKNEYVQFSETKPQLFFVGRLDYYPNYLGIDHFIDNVWPDVLQAEPNAELHIAGKVVYHDRVDDYLEKWCEIQGVQVLVFLESLDAEYAACRATVSPIYEGAGTNIKLLEALQRKRVCVTTECGARGMNGALTNGEDVLIAKDDAEYAQLVIRALTDEAFNVRVAQHGYEKYMKHFSQEAFMKTITDQLR